MPEVICCHHCEMDHDCECVLCSSCSAVAEDPLCSRCNECDDCCECSHCESCSVPCESVCDRCDRCERCCECGHCECCGEAVLSTCCDCDRCPECCNCSNEDDEDESVVRRRDGRNVFHTSQRNQFKVNSSRRFLACELEFSDAADGDAIYDAVSNWQGAIVSDGSLPSTGFELCTAPANGDLFVDQIGEICEALAEQHAQINTDCGFHVHVDARDFRYWDLRKLILLYAKIEDALFAIVPKSRRKNSFCEPCGMRYVNELTGTRAVKQKIIQNVYDDASPGPAFKGKRSDKYCGSRYRALNLHSWFYRGTVECRLAAGTRDREKIVPWATLWAAIVDFAYRHSESRIANLAGSSLDVLLCVAPSDAVRDWIHERIETFRNIAA